MMQTNCGRLRAWVGSIVIRVRGGFMVSLEESSRQDDSVPLQSFIAFLRPVEVMRIYNEVEALGEV